MIRKHEQPKVGAIPKTAALSGMAALAGLVSSGTARAAIYTGTYDATVNNDATLDYDSTGDALVVISDNGHPLLTVPADAPATGDSHIYVNNKESDNLRFLSNDTTNSQTGVVANIAAGTILGPSATVPSGTAYVDGSTSSNANNTDGDIAYVDTSSSDAANGTVYTPTGHSASEFVVGTTGYIGFYFTNANTGNTDYGYISVNLDTTGDASGTFAYYDDGTPIAVGATTEAVPEPTGLALLAAGGAALLRRRQRSV